MAKSSAREDDVPLDVHRRHLAAASLALGAFAAAPATIALRPRQQQQDRGGLEGEQELLEQQAADRGRVAEAGLDVGAVGAERHQRGAEDGDRELDEEGAAEQRRQEALAGDRLPGRLVAAADVGDDEDVEDHHRAGVDDHLGGGDEGRA